MIREPPSSGGTVDQKKELKKRIQSHFQINLGSKTCATKTPAASNLHQDKQVLKIITCFSVARAQLVIPPPHPPKENLWFLPVLIKSVETKSVGFCATFTHITSFAHPARRQREPSLSKRTGTFHVCYSFQVSLFTIDIASKRCALCIRH